MSEHAFPPLPAGFRASAVAAGVKKAGTTRLDLGLLLADEAWPAACLFTTNKLQGAHIAVCRDHLKRSGGLVRAVLVNAGNANCATGAEGIDDAFACAEKVASEIGCPPEQVLPMSTGVIGARLPTERLFAAIPGLVRGVSADSDGSERFARSIMTTDTFPKTSATDEPRVVGFAKGSGMIHPDMATMLAFIVSDARIDDPRSVLIAASDRSFHCLSVDGDTSPNDSVLLWGSGHTEVPQNRLQESVTQVSTDLCQRIARDGEGATRIVEIRIRGARSEAEARLAAKTIATSPLVKTAIAGRDPNWGRILSAIGRSGASIDFANAHLAIGPHCVYQNGEPHPENEAAASDYLVNEERIELNCELGRGEAALVYWTCDLTADYVRINADYRS